LKRSINKSWKTDEKEQQLEQLCSGDCGRKIRDVSDENKSVINPIETY
jgi:hypothetical protein